MRLSPGALCDQVNSSQVKVTTYTAPQSFEFSNQMVNGKGQLQVPAYGRILEIVQ